MTTLLNRFKNVAATATTLGRSGTPSSSATSTAQSTTSQRTGLSATLKRHLYVNPVMSVTFVLGSLGFVLPTSIYLMGGERENERSGRLTRWKNEWQHTGQEQRRQRILKEIGEQKDERLEALKSQMQSSGGKYTAPQ